ncbi:carboxylesterase [Melampsora americana]|nr:carboxylesterase [Melampsora americana]
MLFNFIYHISIFLTIFYIFPSNTKSEPITKLLILPEGIIRGVQTQTAGVFRYTIPYARPPVSSLRWSDPVPPLKWNGIRSGTELPSACPQSQMNGYELTNEDCLYLSVYVPDEIFKPMPIFVWVHGGSLIQGGATGYGLDGSSLAVKSGMIVIVVQYRLGLLGFLRTPPIRKTLNGNYGLKDLIMALKYIHKNAAYLGGDQTRITLAGQSSGASLIKTLLTVESASELFQRAILHSCPLNYGDHSTAALSILKPPGQDLRRVSVSDILAAQDAMQENLPTQIPGIASSEPFRPVIDGSLVTIDFINAMNKPSFNIIGHERQIIFTTVKDEAGPTIAESFEVNTPSFITSSKVYSNELKSLIDRGIPDPTREELTVFGTDYIWRCANQQAAVNLTLNSISLINKQMIWIAEFDIGIPYNSTINIKYCRSKVCHEDDILTVFGLPPDRTPNELSTRLINEIQTRWGAFARSGNPNSIRLTPWYPVEGRNKLNLLRIERKRSVSLPQHRPRACDQLWGVKARFDAQIYS